MKGISLLLNQIVNASSEQMKKFWERDWNFHKAPGK